MHLIWFYFMLRSFDQKFTFGFFGHVCSYFYHCRHVYMKKIQTLFVFYHFDTGTYWFAAFFEELDQC